MLLLQGITHLMLHQHFKKAEDFTDSFLLLFSLYIIFQCSGRLPFTTCFLSAKRNVWSAYLIWKSQNTRHIQLKCVATSVCRFSVFLCFFVASVNLMWGTDVLNLTFSCQPKHHYNICALNFILYTIYFFCFYQAANSLCSFCLFQTQSQTSSALCCQPYCHRISPFGRDL